MSNKIKAILITLTCILSYIGFIVLVISIVPDIIFWILAIGCLLFCMYYFFKMVLEDLGK